MTATEQLPDLGSAFTDAMKSGDGTFDLPPDSPLAKAVEKQPTPIKEPVAEKQVDKQPADKPPEKAEKPPEAKVESKKKSALDAAISDEAPVEVPVDEAAKAFEAESPNKENWAKARETFKSQSAKLKEYESKLAQASAPAPEVLTELKTIKAEREKLVQENAKMRDSIIALDVRFDPNTQEKIAHRDKQATSLADRVADAGGNKEAFLQALELPLSKRGKALDAALDGIESARELSSINAKLGMIEVADEQLDELLNQPHKSFEELKLQRELQVKEQREKIEQFKEATFENVKRELPKLSKLMRLAPEDSEGAKEFNETLLSDIARAPQLLEVEPREAVVQAYKAARYDSVERIALGLHSRVSELEAELSKYHGSEPGFRGGGKAPVKADYEVPLEKAFFDAMGSQQPI